MFLQCQVSMSTTVPAPAPVGHGSLTVTRPRGTCLGLATRVWDTLHVRGGRGVTGLDWVLLCSVVFRADSSVAAPHQCGWHAASAASAQLAGPTSNIWRAPAFIPSLPGCEYAGPVSTSPATLMSLWPVLASLSLFN